MDELGLGKLPTAVGKATSDGFYYDNPDDGPEVLTLLESSYEAEIEEALKRLLSKLATGCDVSEALPKVLKRIGSSSLYVRRLVSMFLSHYCQKFPDESLLVVNSLQKEISSSHPITKAFALRTLSSVRLPTVMPILLISVRKCVGDPVPYVRQTAAFVLSQIEPGFKDPFQEDLEKLVERLLGDSSPLVSGMAALAFSSICPERVDFLHNNFTKLCGQLSAMDDIGKVSTLEILIRFSQAKWGKNGLKFPVEERETEEMKEKKRGEIELLLKSTQPFLHHENSAVVLAAAQAQFLWGGDHNRATDVAPALVCLLETCPDSVDLILKFIKEFSKDLPQIFSDFFGSFFVLSSDPLNVRVLKLQILRHIITKKTSTQIFQEMEVYLEDPDPKFVAESLKIMREMACSLGESIDSALQGFLKFVKRQLAMNLSPRFASQDLTVLGAALRQISKILDFEQDKTKHEKVLVQLAETLKSLTEAKDRALVLWLLTRHCHVGPTLCQLTPLVLSHLASRWDHEGDEVKSQLVSGSAKVFFQLENEESQLLMKYILAKGLSDNFTLKRKSETLCRLLYHRGTFVFRNDLANFTSSAILGNFEDEVVKFSTLSTEFVKKLVLQEEFLDNFGAHEPNSGLKSKRKDDLFLPGTLSSIVGHMAPRFEPVSSLTSDLKTQIANFREGNYVLKSESEESYQFPNEDITSQEGKYEEKGQIISDFSLEKLENWLKQ